MQMHEIHVDSEESWYSVLLKEEDWLETSIFQSDSFGPLWNFSLDSGYYGLSFHLEN